MRLRAELDWFCEYALPLFGTYQDALAEASPWLFHGLISMYLNCGLLEPLSVCEQVEAAYRRGQCSLSAAEGFIRQILGWREYVRGLYWHHMPDYKARNALSATRALPDWLDGQDSDALFVTSPQAVTRLGLCPPHTTTHGDR